VLERDPDVQFRAYQEARSVWDDQGEKSLPYSPNLGEFRRLKVKIDVKLTHWTPVMIRGVVPKPNEFFWVGRVQVEVPGGPAPVKVDLNGYFDVEAMKALRTPSSWHRAVFEARVDRLASLWLRRGSHG